MSKQETEFPPRPEEVLESTDYQRLRDLDDEEYRRLAEDIKENGVLQPVHIDEDGQIIDGHNRVTIATYYGLDYPTEVREGLTEEEKSALAVKLNCSGREVGASEKREAVKRHIKSVWPRDENGKIFRRHQPQAEVAEKTGVSRKTVARALTDLGNNGHLSKIPQARRQVREYYEEDPERSYREIAREVDLDHKTVANWIRQDFETAEEDGKDEELAESKDEDGDPEAGSESEPEPQADPSGTDGDEDTDGNDPSSSSPKSGDESTSRSWSSSSSGGGTGGKTRTATTGAGIDPYRGVATSHSTEDILGGTDGQDGRGEDEDDEDRRSSRRRRPISFTNKTVRQQLIEEGSAITARHSTETIGRRPWNTGFGEPEEGYVLIAGFGEVNLADAAALEEFVHRSGYETIEGWQEAIGVGEDADEQLGYLYLVNGDDLEDGTE